MSGQAMSPSASVPIACPCGQTLAITVESMQNHWVTIRNGDYMDVIRAEIRCQELLASGGNSACGGVGEDSQQEFHDQTWRIIDRSGNLLECPHCRRLLWMRPGDSGYRAFTPEQVPVVTPGRQREHPTRS